MRLRSPTRASPASCIKGGLVIGVCGRWGPGGGRLQRVRCGECTGWGQWQQRLSVKSWSDDLGQGASQ